MSVSTALAQPRFVLLGRIQATVDVATEYIQTNSTREQPEQQQQGLRESSHNKFQQSSQQNVSKC